MDLRRRDFLKAASLAGCLAPLPGIAQLAWADTPSSHPLLVTVFLRGGADGLNLVAPSNDADYVAARPAELRVQDSGERAGLRLEQTLAPGLDFRLHPEAAPLQALYGARRLAVLHAIGLTDGTRSHFVAQDLMERGIADERRMARTTDGWLARASHGSDGRVALYSATSSPAFALRGGPPPLSVPDLGAGVGLPWGNPTQEFLRTLYGRDPSPLGRAGSDALALFESIDRKLAKDSAGKVLPYRPEGGASYDAAGDLARTLTSVARLARMEVGLTAACVDHQGWDTHEGQPGRFANQVRQLATGLGAFHDDLAASGKKAVILVMTEFGRRLRANKSNGTDHGHGACWLVLGDGVRGGDIAGQWPGLSTRQLDQGVDLAVTTDYREILAETLALGGLNPRDALPEWRPPAASLHRFS